LANILDLRKKMFVESNLLVENVLDLRKKKQRNLLKVAAKVKLRK
jgi:hypothetical protein